jgi:hypothetical protein
MRGASVDIPEDFQKAITDMQSATQEFCNGNANPTKALWSHFADATIMGLVRARKRKGFGWKRWSSQWLRKRRETARPHLRSVAPFLDPTLEGVMETAASFEARFAPWSYPASVTATEVKKQTPHIAL